MLDKYFFAVCLINRYDFIPSQIPFHLYISSNDLRIFVVKVTISICSTDHSLLSIVAIRVFKIVREEFVSVAHIPRSDSLEVKSFDLTFDFD